MHLLSSRRSLGQIILAFFSVLLVALGVTSPRAARAQTLAWAARYNGTGNGDDQPTGRGSMAVDAHGAVYVTGYAASNDASENWATVKYGANGQQQWVATYNGAANSGDYPYGIAVDAQNGVYVTGYSAESPGSGAISCTTIKYNGSTGQQQWKQMYRAPVSGDSASGLAIAVNPQQPNSVYVAGYVSRGVSTTSAYDYVALRYDTNTGARRWVALYNGPDNKNDYPISIAADMSGNGYVTGFSVNAAGNYDYLTVKFGAATGQAAWAQRYNGPGNREDRASALIVDAQGNVSVTGSSDGGNSTGDDYATIKYNGATGAPIWTQRYDNAAVHSSDSATGIGADSAGNIYVTGDSDGGNPAVAGNTGADYATIKYDTDSGGQIWVARYDGGYPSTTSNRRDFARDLAVDSVGSVYVTGSSFGVDRANNGTAEDVATVKYDRFGTLQWSRRYNSNDTNGDALKNNRDFGQSVALDGQGNVYVGAYVYLPSNGVDYLTLRYTVGSIWSAQDIAVGNDNKTRFLWNRTDGKMALWTVAPTGAIEKSAAFGPFAGLTARAIAVGSDNKVRVLWDGGAGKAVVWTVKSDLSAPETGYTFNAVGYYPWEIAVGPADGKTRISWYDARNRVAIWTLTGSAIAQSVLFNQPTGGYIDQAIAVGADNRTRLLWNSDSLAKTALWSLNATTPATIDSGYSYGPLSPANVHWFAADLAVGMDNKPRLLWTNDDGGAALWQIASGNSAIEKNIALGPLPTPGWVPARIGFSGGSGSDGNVRLLWNAPTGAALLYTVNPLTGAIVATVEFGPL